MFITVHGHHQIWSLLLLLLSVFYIINVDTGSQALSRQTPLLLAVIKHWDTPHSALGSPSPCGFHAASTGVGERAREHNRTSSTASNCCLAPGHPPHPYLKVCPISQHQLQPYSQQSNRSGLKQKSDPALPLLRTARPLRGREVCKLTCLNCPMRPRPHALPPPRAPATLASRMRPITVPRPSGCTPLLFLPLGSLPPEMYTWLIPCLPSGVQSTSYCLSDFISIFFPKEIR